MGGASRGDRRAGHPLTGRRAGLAWVALLGVGAWLGASGGLGVQDLGALRGSGWRGQAVFVAVYAVATMLLLPASPFSLAAGVLWGPLVGAGCAWLGAMLGAQGMFALSRRARGGWVQVLSRTSLGQGLAATLSGVDDFRTVLLLRMSPLMPFSVLNAALGLSRVSPWAYAWATGLGILPGLVLYVGAGAALGDLAAVGDGPVTTPAMRGWFLAGLVATAIAVRWIGQRAARRLAESGGTLAG